MGRFTALDPARDMRGDGDLWDYCVDDPINCVDPWGLADIPWWVPQKIVRNGARQYAKEFGYDLEECSDDDIDEMINTVPNKKVDEFKKSYDRRPDAATPLSKETDSTNAKEYDFEKQLIDEMVKKYGKDCIKKSN